MIRLAALLSLIAAPAAALTLDFGGPAQSTAESVQRTARADLARGAFADGAVPTLGAEGVVTRRAWRLGGRAATTLQILAPLRAQLGEAGYETLFACRDRACGGFDFRFAAGILDAPAMHVDLGDFHYLLARRGEGEGAETVALVVSRAPSAGFVQLTHVAPPGAPEPRIVVSSRGGPVAAGGIAAALRDGGQASLDDLVFGVGSADLDAGPFGSLDALAAFVTAAPDRVITLVGHTDATGAFDANVALSRRRAEAVRARLIALGAPAERLRAEGVGPLVPRTANATEAGRRANRRVEAVLTE